MQKLDIVIGDNTIKYCKSILNDPIKTIYIIAHELGHALDFKESSLEEQVEILNAVELFNFSLENGISISEELLVFVITSENIACDYAEHIISFIGAGYSKNRARKIRTSLLRNYVSL